MRGGEGRCHVGEQLMQFSDILPIIYLYYSVLLLLDKRQTLLLTFLLSMRMAWHAA